MPYQFAFNLTPIVPVWLIASLAAALALLLAHGSLQLLRKKIPPRWVTTLGLLRAVIIAVLVVCLLQPVVSYTRSVERRPDLLVLVDTSQSMGINDAPSQQSRLDSALRTLRGSELLGQLGGQFNVCWFAFDRNAYPLDDADLNGLKASGDSTRFSEALSAAFEYQRQVGAAPPARALLVSDGNDSGGEDVAQTARRLGLAVDTLAPASAEAPAGAERVVIASVQSPRSVLLGAETRVVATLRADATVRTPLQLSLLDAGRTVASQAVEFRASALEQVVRLTHRPEKIGLRQYELRLSEQASAAPYHFSVRVIDDRKQVLILEDNWRWEFKFLRRVIEDDPHFSFTAMLPRGSGMHAHFTEADQTLDLSGFPQRRGELSWFDVIVVGDVEPRRWPAGMSAALAQVVKDEGKSLVVVAGPGLTNLAAVPELNALLPVEVTSESATPLEGPIEVRPSRDAVASPFFFDIAGLPPLERIYPPLRKRPAATILLEAGTRGNAYGSLIVMAEHTVGRGRVLFVGTDALWNWQMSASSDAQNVTPYAAFWQQSLRALAPPFSRKGRATLALQPERSRYEAGQRVVLQARYESDQPIAAPTIESSVTLPDQREIPIAFTPDPAQPDTYQAEFEATLAGQYMIAAEVRSEGKGAVADARTAVDVESPRGEISSAGVDEANLARIAAATGGSFIRFSDRATWPDVQPIALQPAQETRNVHLWNNLTLLIILCGLLGIDWSLRLLRGYV